MYNLLGSFEEEQSLVLTHDDLFDYLFSILGADQKLPLELRNQLVEAQAFVFLGFDFQAWYVKLLLRMLNIHTQGKVPLVSQGKNGSRTPPNELKNFYVSNFQMQFLELEAEDLIDQLFERFGDSQADSLALRKLSEQQTPEIVGLVKDLTREGKLTEVFDLLYDYLEGRNPQLSDDLTLLEGRFTRNERKFGAEGVIKNEDYNLELNKIQAGILQIVNQLKGGSP